MFILTSKISILSGLMFTDNTFLIYNASAGSGKTYTLVKTYLALLLGNRSDKTFGQILAITFTNKAAAEMKLRILEKLHDLSLASSADADLKKDLSRQLKLDEEALTEKARQVLKNLLHNYRDFSVSTIDAFTVKIVRSFAPDFRLSYRFNIELDTDSLARQAIDLMFNELESQPELIDFLLDFSLQEIEEDRSWDISGKLFDSVRKLNYENAREPMEKVLGKSLSHYTKFLKSLIEKRTQTLQNLSALAKTVLQHFNDSGLNEEDFKGKYVPNFFKKIGENPQRDIKLNAKWIVETDTADLYNKGLPDDKKEIIDGLRPWLIEQIVEVKTHCARLLLIDKINKSLRPLAVLDRLKYWYDFVKEENRLLPLFEANQLIWEQVRDQEAPFIYERLGQKFRYYFIDEFQDTSRRQWENLIPLTAHTLTVEHGKHLPGLVMLVGDAKQSIYSWRGGDPQQFIKLCSGISPYQLPLQYKVLENNYRSRAEIVAFNNSFFTKAAEVLHPNYREIYQNSCDQNPKREMGGYVRVDFFEVSNKEEKNNLHPPKILEVIQEVQTLGYTLSDICILVRKNEYAKHIARFLTENQIPVVSAESLLLSSSAQVNFLMQWMKIYQNHNNEESKIKILNYFAEQLRLASDKIHAFMREHISMHPAELWEAFGQSNTTFLQTRNLNLYEWAETTIAHFNLCPEANPYLSSFMDYLLEFALKQPAYPSAFLKLWEENAEKWSLSEASGCQAVQVMTIHKSKGLQFPIVIYAYADETLYDRTKTFDWLPIDATEWGGFEQVEITYNAEMISLSEDWAAREQSLKDKAFFEAFNNIYVAQTRAEEQLYILSSFKKSAGNDIKNQTDLYLNYLDESGQSLENYRYETGKPLAKENRENRKDTDTLIDTWMYPPKTTGIHAVATQAALLWSSRSEAAVEKGKLWHLLLAGIYTKAEILPAVEKAIGEGLLQEKERENTLQALTKIVEHKSLQPFFNPEWKILNERSLMVNGRIYRPDRVVLKDRKAVVIDYKTGAKKPAYEAQMLGYVNALTEMDYKVEAALLVYLKDETEVIRIKF